MCLHIKANIDQVCSAARESERLRVCVRYWERNRERYEREIYGLRGQAASKECQLNCLHFISESGAAGRRALYRMLQALAFRAIIKTLRERKKEIYANRTLGDIKIAQACQKREDIGR